MKDLLLIFTFLLLGSVCLKAKALDDSPHLKMNRIDMDRKSEVKISVKDFDIHFFADTNKKAFPKDRSKIGALIIKLDKKIKDLEKEQQLSLEKERSLFGTLTQGLTDSFLEQKLNYFKSLRNFLSEEKEKLEKLGIGVKKAGDTVSDML